MGDWREDGCEGLVERTEQILLDDARGLDASQEREIDDGVVMVERRRGSVVDQEAVEEGSRKGQGSSRDRDREGEGDVPDSEELAGHFGG